MHWTRLTKDVQDGHGERQTEILDDVLGVCGHSHRAASEVDHSAVQLEPELTITIR